MSYIWFALASAITFGFSILLVKYISKYIIKDSSSLLFWGYVTTLPFVAFIPIWQGWQFDWSFILPVFLHSLLLTSGTVFFIKGLKQTDASVIGPLFQLQSGFIVILAAIFLNEQHSTSLYGALLLLTLGAMFVSVTDKSKWRGLLEPGVISICIMQLLHAGANIAVGFALKNTNSWQILFYSMVFNSIISISIAIAQKQPITRDLRKISWMLLRAFLTVLGTAFLYQAYKTNISISASFGLLSAPLVFVISLLSAWLVPGLLEKQSLKTYLIRVVGMVIILLSAWMVMKLR